MSALAELEARLSEIEDVQAAAALLGWDQSTHMPPGGAEARGHQLATLGRLTHQLRTATSLGDLLSEAAREVKGLPDDSPRAALVRVAARDRARAVRVPEQLVGELKTHLAASYVAWTRARVDADFDTMRPYLEKTLELSRRWSDCFEGWDHPADPHMDAMDEGMTAASVGALFSELRKGLVPLVQAIGERPAPRDDFLYRSYPKDVQLAFGEWVIGELGYDFRRGRQDLTPHPFMTRFSIGDVRITSRVNTNDFGDCFFSTIHECGHALYEQGVDPTFERSPLAHGVSAGVHESQSRMLENMVARSRGFCRWLLPLAQERFPTQLGDVTKEELYRAVNRVQPSLIRTDADEVTYNLHVMIRVDLAMAMLEGRLAVKDLPDAWNARYQKDLGVRPPDVRMGVLQDVHWYADTIGGQFQGYTLGNMTSAQLFRTARQARPEIEERIAEGDLGPLLEWLREHVHRHGSVFSPADLVERVTGKPLGPTDFLEYLRTKFGDLYGLREVAPRTVAGSAPRPSNSL